MKGLTLARSANGSPRGREEMAGVTGTGVITFVHVVVETCGRSTLIASVSEIRNRLIS